MALLLCAAPRAHAAVWYSNAASTAPEPDGKNWATAYPAIQPAVDAAASGDEVWVAAGTYTGTGEQVVDLKDGVTLYGGFTGAETARDERDWKAHAVIIDGQQARRCVTATVSGAVDGFTLSNGMSGAGAGMFFGAAINCTFSGNCADDEGGGMAYGTAMNCKFIGNSSMVGAGMSSSTAVNCIFTGNTASGYGGGMLAGTSVNCIVYRNRGGGIQGDAVNCTIVDNFGYEIGYDSSGFSGRTAVNCIIWGNTPEDIHSGQGTASHCCLSQPFEGEGNIVGNPRFVDPVGGDFRLRADSPCVDSGTWDNAPATDQLGRIRPQGMGVDMGAYEYHSGDDEHAVDPPPVLRVNGTVTPANPDGLTWETAFPTLQAAADFAGYGSEIWVAQGTYTAEEGGQVVRLAPGTYVYGGFTGTEANHSQRDWVANSTTIDGQGVRRCVTGNAASSIDGFALQNGKDSGGYSRDGGGMSSGRATNCTFKDNVSSGHGGGMAYGTSVNCVFVGNRAVYGGGKVYGTAVNCTFTGNSDRSSVGGMASGVAVNCIIWGNSPDEIRYTDVSHSCLPITVAGEGNIVGNPGFVNPCANDLRLRLTDPVFL